MSHKEDTDATNAPWI